MDSSSCYFPNAFANASEEAAEVVVGSVRYLNNVAWNNSCSCSEGGNQTQFSSCAAELIALRFAPQNSAELNVCEFGSDPTTVGVVSLFVALYFAFPLMLCVFFTVRAKRINIGGIDADANTTTSAPVVAAASLTPRPLARLAFEQLSFTVTVGSKRAREEKKILNNLTAALEPETLTAIMGPSGCGKSTLLDILANRQTKGNGTITGNILLNEEQLNTKYWRRISGYVTQFDVLFPYLTVTEMLTFSAMLRSSDLDFNAQVLRVLRELELMSCKDTQIGDKFNKGISGGQARRVTVGLELLANPIVLFLDEPTSGLDSTSAKSLVETLKRLTISEQMTIACTIHQPRSSTFQLFDRLILMKSGELAYAGTLKDIPLYLETNLGLQVDAKANLADFIVDLTYPREDNDNEEVDGTVAVVDRLVGAWANSSNAKQEHAAATITTTQNMLIDYVKSQSVDGQSKYVQSLPKQVEILLRRSYLNAMRNRGYHTALVLQNCQYLFYGLLFVGLRIYGSDSGGDALQENQVNLFRKNFLYQVMNTVCIVESVVISSAFLEKNLFYREFASGSYSVLAYHLTWYIRLTVDSTWKGCIAAVLCYFFPPMRMEAQAFFFFAVVLMVVSSLGSVLGFFMACLINDVEGAANIHNTVIGFMGTYAGFFLPSLLIPVFTLWAYYLSFFKYSFEALTLNEFGPCASQYMLTQFLSVDMTLNRWTNILVLMAYPIIFHMLAFAGTLAMTGYFSRKRSGASKQQQKPEETNSIQLV